MEDWKGNKIQVGQTIVVVSTESRFEFNTIKKSYLFDVDSKYFIVSDCSNLSICSNKMEVPIHDVDFWIVKQPWQIICIEGISDNKHEYYKHYFNM